MRRFAIGGPRYNDLLFSRATGPRVPSRGCRRQQPLTFPSRGGVRISEIFFAQASALGKKGHPNRPNAAFCGIGSLGHAPFAASRFRKWSKNGHRNRLSVPNAHFEERG